jgi:hypothetical protein
MYLIYPTNKLPYFFQLNSQHTDAFVPSGMANIVSDGAFAFLNVHKHHFHYSGLRILVVLECLVI